MALGKWTALMTSLARILNYGVKQVSSALVEFREAVIYAYPVCDTQKNCERMHVIQVAGRFPSFYPHSMHFDVLVRNLQRN